MLKSSEFNSAVPKFTNGNYASNPIDPTNIEEPSAQDYVRGAEPLDTLPAQWWNWLCNQFTSRFNKLNTYVKNIFDELTGFLSLLNITPDGTESAITTGQLKNAFKEDYPSYINDKLELGTTYVKRTQKINNHALSGDITVTKSDVGLGNVPNVSTNDQTPTYTEASTLTALSSGEKLSIAFGKLTKAVSSLISHINNTNNPHSVTKAQVQLGDVVNTGDSATPVENGTTKFTTGGAYTLKKDLTDIAESLPTDAVLHYSFDEVPDYPDGTAVYKRDNDWVDSDNWNSDYSNTTFSVSNGIAKWTVTNGSTIQLSKVIQNSADKIIKIRIKSSEVGLEFRVMGKEDSSFKRLATVITNGNWQDIVCYKPSTYNEQIVLILANNTENTSIEISQIYVGDGSYSTPIIDNVNGQFNAENNGLLPQQGMSGKGTVSFDKYTYAKSTNFKIKPPYSYSLWIKINSDIVGTQYLLDGRNGSITTADEGIIITSTKSIIVGIGNSDVTSGNNVVPLNEWFHIVVTCNDEGTGSRYKVYRNGSLINSGLTSSKSTGFVQLVVNARYADVLNYAKSNRQLDDLLFFDRTLSDTEVKALYYNKANTPKYYGDVPVTRTVNGQTLDKDIVLDKTDVGLTNVVNTGDSATPVSGGTTKFTTGGAYNLLLNLAPAFSTSTAYSVNQLVTYNGVLYKCSTAHSAGAWNSNHFTAVTLNDVAGVTGVKGNNENDYRKGNVNITKGNVGLGSVIDTGDSATPVSGGLTKFTTGGAYTELNKKFDKTSAGDQVTYSLSGNTLTITSLS
jgi:hypothetical protein